MMLSNCTGVLKMQDITRCGYICVYIINLSEVSARCLTGPSQDAALFVILIVIHKMYTKLKFIMFTQL